MAGIATVRARPGCFGGLNVLHRKSSFCGAFAWARRALNGLKRRFPAREVCENSFTSSDSLYICDTFDMCDWGCCGTCMRARAPKPAAQAAAQPASPPGRQGACATCKGALLPYRPGHPAFGAVGEISDWSCDTVRAHPGRLSALSVLHSKSVRLCMGAHCA